MTSRASIQRLAVIAPESRARNHEPAGVATRGAAAVVDAVVVIVALLLGYLAVAGVRFLLAPRRFRFPAPSLATLISIACALAVLYLAVAWATTGRTYGDQVLGLRVVTRAGTRPHAGRALLRAVAYVAVPVGLLWVAVSNQNRSVQDLLVGTSVIYDWE
jgi:uncharacterized RDD family membrane protein YckC